jgi:hypothetical protein
MKHFGVMLLGFALPACSVLSVAQVVQRTPDVQQVKHKALNVANTPTPEDIYCGGFISTQRIPDTKRVIAGQNSPDQDHFGGTSDRVFILGAGDSKPGDRLSILRLARNPNAYETYTGQQATQKKTGQPYFERGYVRVLEVQNNVAIAVPELSCADIIPGDIAVPFVEREKPVFRDLTLDRYAQPNGKAAGRIVMANEFDTYLGSTQKVYLNIGEDKGLKVGDYLRVTRRYDYSFREPESGLSRLATEADDTAYKAKKATPEEIKQLPRLTVGDVMVLSVHGNTATAMIMTALEDIRIGDAVELMDVSGAPAK